MGKTKHSGKIIPYITIDGIKTYDTKLMANEFGRFYVNMGKDLVNKMKQSSKALGDYIPRIPRTLNSLVMTPTSITEMKKIIDNLPNKSSSRHDKLSNIVLKYISDSILYPLNIIFNQSWQSGQFPDFIMKLAKIIPLFKSKDEDQVIRLVSLLMTLSEVLEKIVYKHMYSFMNINNIFLDSQYGFRTKRSCEHAILEMMGHLLQAKNSNKHSSGVFLDLSKPFDTLDHKLLLEN